MKGFLKYYIRIVMLLMPFLFVPFVFDSFGLGKTALLTVTGLVGLLIWVLDLVIFKREIIRVNRFFWIMLVLLIWATISLLRLPVGAGMRSWVSTFGFGMLLASFIWTFLWIQNNERGEYKKQLGWLTVSAVIVGIGTIIAFLIPNAKLPVSWPKNNPILTISAGWSLTGSILGEIILFLFLAIEWLGRLLKKLKEKSDFGGYFKEAIVVMMLGLVLFVSIYRMVKLGWGYLDNKTSWVVATESLKNNPVFGVGTGNFLEAFKRFRPVSFNNSGYWAVSFYGSSMGILQMWTELGVGALVVIGWSILSWLKQKGKKGFWQAGILGGVFLFLPMAWIGVLLLVWWSSVRLFEDKEVKAVLKFGEKKFNILPYILSVLVLAGVGVGGYWWVRIVAGDFYWQKSLLAANKNDGIETYNMQIKAIGLNPRMGDYRAVYSQTNLALANGLASQKELNDSDKEKMSVLIQQAVREAKAAVSLDGNNVSYWSNLAAIYKTLAGTVEGAADWSAQAYQQAIALDSVDPNLKLNLGGLYFSAERFDLADRAFEAAVGVKSDYANSWYNWAYTAKKLNNLQAAVNRFDQALKLVPVESEDYKSAKEELDAWKKELEDLVAKSKAASENTKETKQNEALKPTDGVVDEGSKVALPTGEEMAPEIVPSVSPGL